MHDVPEARGRNHERATTINSAVPLELNKTLNSSDHLFFLSMPLSRYYQREVRVHRVHFECKFFSEPLLFSIISRENYAFPRECNRYPHNYLLIEKLAAQERGFQFVAQRSNAFMPRKRSRSHFSRSSHCASPPPYSLYLDALLAIPFPSRSSILNYRPNCRANPWFSLDSEERGIFTETQKKGSAAKVFSIGIADRAHSQNVRT